MPKNNKILVMISSPCKEKYPPDSPNAKSLSEIRKKLKQLTESHSLFGKKVFKVWINETEPPEEGSTDSWDACLQAVKDADILISLYNGNAGWAKEGGDIGICHAELSSVLSTAPAKVRLIELEPVLKPSDTKSEERSQRFQDYVKTQSLFRGGSVNTHDELIERFKQSLQASVIDMVHLGGREAKKGKFHLGEALEWSRLDFVTRKDAMETQLKENLELRTGAEKKDKEIFVRIGGELLLVRCHAIPAALSIAAAREMVAQPFLTDHRFSDYLSDSKTGPVHLIACHKTVTEAQAQKFLGFPDATIVNAPFGIYVADDIQKIQLIFLADCRDPTTTCHGVQRLFEWLEQSGEGEVLAKRAASRKMIIKAIANTN